MKTKAKKRMSTGRPTRKGKSIRRRTNRNGSPFFAKHTMEELAKQQGVKPLKDPSVLAGVWPEDEDLDEFIKFTYENRTA